MTFSVVGFPVDDILQFPDLVFERLGPEDGRKIFQRKKRSISSDSFCSTKDLYALTAEALFLENKDNRNSLCNQFHCFASEVYPLWLLYLKAFTVSTSPARTGLR